MEQVDGLEALATDLGVEVHAAGGQPAILEDRIHDLRGEIDVGRELVGVPAHQRVAGVGIDRAQETLHAGILQLMLHLVAGERGVVGLDVHLHMLFQAIGPQEIDAGGAVEVVLMLGGLAGLGLEVKLAGEADLLRVVDGHVHEPGQVVDLPLHVGVPEALVALAATPERIARTAERVGDLHRFLHLCGGIGEDLGVAAGGGAMHVPRIREEVGRAPEELDAGLLLMGFERGGHGIEVLVRLGERLALGGHVAVVETVEAHAELLHELKRHRDPGDRPFEGVPAFFPGADHGRRAEGVAAGAAEGVPVGDGEPQVVAHRLPLDQGVGVVVTKRQHVLRSGALVADIWDAGKRLGTSAVCGCHRKDAPAETNGEKIKSRWVEPTAFISEAMPIVASKPEWDGGFSAVGGSSRGPRDSAILESDRSFSTV